MKRVYLLRHAKSSWALEGVQDHDRPLNKRGRDATPRMAAEMKFRGYLPDAIFCSSAKRNQETLALMLPTLAQDIPTTIDPDLYLAGPDVLLERVRDADEKLNSVMVVAHNPGLEFLVEELAAENASKLMPPPKFPAGALAVIDFDVDEWRKLGSGKGNIVDLLFPKSL